MNKTIAYCEKIKVSLYLFHHAAAIIVINMRLNGALIGQIKSFINQYPDDKKKKATMLNLLRRELSDPMDDHIDLATVEDPAEPYSSA